jgi:hypothetical protein
MSELQMNSDAPAREIAPRTVVESNPGTPISVMTSFSDFP